MTLYDVVLESKRACLLLERCDGGTLLSLVQGRVNDSKARIARERRSASAGGAGPGLGVVVNLFGAPREAPPPYCLSEAEARAGLRAAAEALRYVHDKGFVHRDVKLENLLMAAPLNLATLKLADFGFATLAAGPGAGPGRAPDKGLQGTVEYAAPEILAAYRGRGKNSTAAADADAAVRSPIPTSPFLRYNADVARAGAPRRGHVVSGRHPLPHARGASLSDDAPLIRKHPGR